MKTKLPILLLTVPMIIACGGTSIKDKFKDAKDLGAIPANHFITEETNEAAKDKTDYYKFEVANKITFNSEKWNALTIVAYDTREHYEGYSMPLDIKLYDASFKEIDTINIKEFITTYDPEGGNFEGEGVGEGCAVVAHDVEPGEYYFSLTPKAEVAENYYMMWVADIIGD